MLLEKIGLPAMLEQTAEECTELAQACLKYARWIRNENPTFRDVDEIEDNLAEEVADVVICISELKDHAYDYEAYSDWVNAKKDRIKVRFSDGFMGTDKPPVQAGG